MENVNRIKKHTKVQELTAYELEEVSGGAYYTDTPEYPTSDLGAEVRNSVTEALSNSGLPYPKEKKTYSETYTKEEYTSKPE